MIHLLSPDLINKIAAGEVVERPASVIKELTENAIDAKATSIEVILEKGGIELMKVIDNGVGMNQADARLCLLRHATSKLSDYEDLFHIQSLGFRGEALASIAAVSQFDLVTKTKDSEMGWKVFLDEQLQPEASPTAANTGTVVTVKNIFYYVPARQKFLKTSGTEFAHILKYLQQFSLVHPDKEIKLVHNGKTHFHYPAANAQERVEQVLGKEFSSKLVPVASDDASSIRLQGFIAKPELVHSTHKNQYLFVNNRPIYDGLIARSVLEAYDTLVPRGYFPAFVLFIHIDPQQVDVNVHPRKSEVKFKNASEIISRVKQGVRRSLNSSDLTRSQYLEESISSVAVQSPPVFSMPEKNRGTYTPEQAPSSLQFSEKSFEKRKPSLPKQTLNFSEQSYAGGLESRQLSPLEENEWRIVGQIHRSFILVETPEGLHLLDQHAVSEITNYHRLRTQRENGEICSQSLLIPLQIEVSTEEAVIVEEQQAVFQRLGWELDQQSPTSLQLNALPEVLKVENISENFHDIVSQLKDLEDADMTSRELALLKYEACRGAIMFGDALSMTEMQSLLNQWLIVPNNAACEHGRPAAARISVQEMRKYFKR